MSLKLSDRRWRVTIGDLDVTELDLEFDIMRSAKREPNTAEVSIFGLSRSSRSRIEGADPRRLVVRAGYRAQEGALPVLFVGDAPKAVTRLEKPEIVTTIQARDFGRAYQRARVNQSWSAGTSVTVVLKALVAAMGVGEGNLQEFEQAYALRNNAANFPDGFTASGPVRTALNSIIRGAGLRWSIQNNALQIMRRRTPLQTQAVSLSPASGLIGSPEKDEKGMVSAVALIQPGLDPGRRVFLDSREITGEFEIFKNQTVGQTFGNDWSANLSLKPVQR